MSQPCAFRTIEFLSSSYWPAIRIVARAEFGEAQADEIAQEAVLAALLDPTRLTAPAGRWRWLVALVHTIGGDLAAEGAERSTYEVRMRGLPPASDVTAGEALARDLRRRLGVAWGSLNAVDRRAFALQEVAGLSPAEVATACDATPNAVRQRTFRARRFLRAELDPR